MGVGVLQETETWLNRSDRAWLNAYRKQLAAKFPSVVEQFLVYGSKARGTARCDSDLDVLLIIDDHHTAEKRQLRRVGYLLAAKSDVLPSILVYTRSEWAQRRASGSSFQRAVERDALPVQ
jgi:predicted nucleotidyltransferase